MNRSVDWFYLAHLGYNMWAEPLVDGNSVPCDDLSICWSPYVNATPRLRFEEPYWRELTAELKQGGCTGIVLDIGEGLRFDSHPELAIDGSWSKQKLAEELSRLRDMGFEVIPKLNFSSSHDLWLGEYARMLSTSLYYRVTADLIAETAELFDNPRLFHLGMDEENYQNQFRYNYVVIRQREQWWYDFRKLLEAVNTTGCRPWIWSDLAWEHEEEFLKKMPREVVQSNWYYGHFPEDGSNDREISLYSKLDAAGFDQIPTGSNWDHSDNFSKTVLHCRDKIAPEHLLGFLQTPWHPTMAETAGRHSQAIADMRRGISLFR